MIVGYSAKVQLSLHINGETRPLTQVCDREIFFASPLVLPLGPAIVDITVDGKTDSYQVEILAHESSTRIPIRMKRDTEMLDRIDNRVRELIAAQRYPDPVAALTKAITEESGEDEAKFDEIINAWAAREKLRKQN